MSNFMKGKPAKKLRKVAIISGCIIAGLALIATFGATLVLPAYYRYLMDHMDENFQLVRDLSDKMPPSADIAMADIRETTIPGPVGEVPVRIYTPLEIRQNPPVIVYMHGGGYVIGSYNLTDNMTRSLARGGKCVVISVNYRLAPEFPYPVGINDCEAVLAWVIEHASDFKAPPDRIVVAGESAGANFSTVLCLKARDAGKRIPVAQMLFAPPVGAIDEKTGKTFTSYAENAGRSILTPKSIDAFSKLYLGDPAKYENDQYVHPLVAKDLSFMPRTLIVTYGFDPLRDEGEAYAAKLEAQGVMVTKKRFEGKEHAYLGKEVIALAAEFLDSL
jgi:acetyl esterase